MALNKLFATLRKICYLGLLWSGVLVLCLISFLALQLAISVRAQEALIDFITHHPGIIGLFSVLPLMAASSLMIYLLRHRHTCYTFHSTLLAYDVHPSIMGGALEKQWNEAHPKSPITCEVTANGRTLQVCITAHLPLDASERELADTLHTFAMQELETLLVAKYALSLNIQWTHPSSLQIPLESSTLSNA